MTYTPTIVAIPYCIALAVWLVGLVAWIAYRGRKVASHMDSQCDGMAWTGANGRRYVWRNGSAFDVATGRKVAI